MNVLGTPLRACCMRPMTGFFRNGCCDTSAQDTGVHTVCVIVTASFLAFSRSVGNDLSTPQPAYQFPGLKEGDKWCLCALRWLEAHQAGCAPRVILSATHRCSLDYIQLEDLKAHAADEPPSH